MSDEAEELVAAFRLAVAEWMTDRRASEELPGVALRVLVSGSDSLSLRVLAGMDGATWSEVEPVVREALQETGGAMTVADARLLVVDDWLRNVQRGELVPVWDWGLTELLGEVGGAYEWFGRALGDMESSQASDDERGINAATQTIRREATRVLAMSIDARLSAPMLEAGIRPLWKRDS